MILSGIVYAQNENDAKTMNSAEEQAAKMNYGQCVSQQAVVKKSCYIAVKNALETCKAQVPQDASKKDASKQCKKVYKVDKKQCKTSFKDSKKECAKIKHNFLETLGSALK